MKASENNRFFGAMIILGIVAMAAVLVIANFWIARGNARLHSSQSTSISTKQVKGRTGTVIGKQFIPAHSEAGCASVKKPCIPTKTQVPNQFKVRVLDSLVDGQGSVQFDGRERVRELDVTREQYESLQPGDLWPGLEK